MGNMGNMSKHGYGSVVAMEFRRPPSVDFSDIVEEFDIAFRMVDSRTRALTWHSDDIALIDRDNVRVGLGWLPSGETGKPSHLVVAVGTASEDGGDVRIDPRGYRFLANRIAERTREFLPWTAVLNGEAHQPVSVALIAKTFDLLRIDLGDMAGDAGFANGARRQADAGADARQHAADASLWSRLNLGNSFGQLLLARSEPTEPLRLTIHTLALSLFLYVPPLGAAVFTYTMLRDIFPMAAQTI